MNIVADEGVDRQIVEVLRHEGHDVVYGAELSTDDDEVRDSSVRTPAVQVSDARPLQRHNVGKNSYSCETMSQRAVSGGQWSRHRFGSPERASGIRDTHEPAWYLGSEQSLGMETVR